jgi:hypothetical protein
MRATYSESTPVYTPSINPTAVSGLKLYNINGVDTFVACITTASATYIGLSTDCVNWSVNITPLANLADVAYDGAIFVAVSGDLNYATSPDCVVWTARTFPAISGSNYPSVIGHNGTRFLVLSQIGSGAWYSASGTSWTTFSHGLGGHCYTMLLFGTTLVISRAEDEACLYSLDGTAVALHTGATTNGQIVRDGDALYSPVSNTESVDGVAWAASSRTALSLGFNSTAARAPENTSPFDSLILAVHSVAGNAMDVWAYDAVGSRDHVLDFGTYTASGLTPYYAPIAWVDSALVIVNAYPYPVARFEFQLSAWSAGETPCVESANDVAWSGQRWIAGGYGDTGTSIGTSSDGRNWLLHDLPDPSFWALAAVCGGPFGVCGIFDTPGGMWPHMSYDHGETWVAGPAALSGGYAEQMLWIGDRFVAATYDNYVEYSFDGLVWHAVTLPVTGAPNWGRVAWNGSVLIVCSSNTADAAYSLDSGLTWFATTAVATDAVAGFKGMFYALVNTEGFPRVWSSANGAAWVQGALINDTGVSGPPKPSRLVASATELCAVVGGWDNALRSFDGAQWSGADFLPSHKNWYTVASDGRRFLALNYDDRSSALSLPSPFWAGFINCEEAT